MKDVVHLTKVKEISDLKQRTTAAVETIDKEMLRWTWTEFECRLDVLCNKWGSYTNLLML